MFILTKAHLGGTELGDHARGAGELQSPGVMTALPFLVLSSSPTHFEAFSSLQNLGCQVLKSSSPPQLILVRPGGRSPSGSAAVACDSSLVGGGQLSHHPSPSIALSFLPTSGQPDPFFWQ